MCFIHINKDLFRFKVKILNGNGLIDKTCLEQNFFLFLLTLMESCIDYRIVKWI